MKKIILKLNDKICPVFICGDLNRFARLTAGLKPSKIAVISNPRVKALHNDKLKSAFKSAGLNYELLVIPDGERFKTLNTALGLCRRLIRSGFDRKSVLIGFGGGVIGDICGFVASTYMRGVRFIQLPTTLLAQVDASIGGKTAVNLPEGKNLVGSFYQPEIVWCNPNFLLTLPKFEWQNGLAEVIKYGVIKDKVFFELIEQNLKLPVTGNSLTEIIYKSALIKARVVQEDEKETRGVREILNFGHTFGHLLESYSGYKKLKHGQAVGLGMVFASLLAEQQGIFKETKRLTNALEKAGLPVKLPRVVKGAWWEKIMFGDKKFTHGKSRFVLPLKIGRVKVFSGISISEIRKIVAMMNREVLNEKKDSGHTRA